MLTIDQVIEAVRQSLSSLKPFFLPEAQISLLVRVPGRPDCDMLFTGDDHRELVLALERLEKVDSAKSQTIN